MGRNAEPLEEWHDARDNDMAGLLEACDELDAVRAFFLLCRQRSAITVGVYREYADRLDVIARGLSIGRRATACLRNRPPV